METLSALHQANAKEMTERNGISVPATYSGFESEYFALRNTVALSDYSHYTKIKIEGDEAFDLLDFAVAGDVAEIRDEQTLYTVLLDEEGKIITDLYVLNDDDTYLVLAEHITDEALIALFEERKGDFEDVEISSLTESHAIVAIEGPYSWELAKEVYGMDVIGVPFLGFIALEDDTYLLRAGKHGEYGYKVALPNELALELWQSFEKKGQRYELVKAGLELHKTSRLENPYFTPDVVGAFSRDPRELQLQWMVRYDKEEFVGRDGLLERREESLANKVIGFVFDGEVDPTTVAAHDKVITAGGEIGEVISVCYSPSMKKTIAQVFVNADYAYAGIEEYVIQASGQELSGSTTSTPFFINKSMLINPNEHSFVNPEKFKNVIEQFEAKAASERSSDEKAVEEASV